MLLVCTKVCILVTFFVPVCQSVSQSVSRPVVANDRLLRFILFLDGCSRVTSVTVQEGMSLPDGWLLGDLVEVYQWVQYLW